MAQFLALLALSGLVGQAAALRIEPKGCPSVSAILDDMKRNASDRAAQVTGCQRLVFCSNLSVEGQDEAVALGSLNVSIQAMRQFPDDVDLQSACISATSQALRFNRANALLAGRLGGLNLTLAAYQRWMDVSPSAVHGRSIAAYLEGCDENLAILRDLGGVDLLMQNIRNHFHGNLSDWAYKPVESSLSGLAAGCWKNTDLCYSGGLLQLAVQLLDEHAGEGELVEEAVGVLKVMIFENINLRAVLSRAGLMPVLAKILKESLTPRATFSACEAISTMTGPLTMTSPSGNFAFKSFQHEIQANATRDGVLKQLLATLLFARVDDVDAVQAECLGALRRMGRKNDANAQAIMQTGLPDRMVGKLITGRFRNHSSKAACTFFSTPGLAPAPKRSVKELCLKLESGAGSEDPPCLDFSFACLI